MATYESLKSLRTLTWQPLGLLTTVKPPALRERPDWEAGVKPLAWGPRARGESLAAREPTERPMVDEKVMEEVVERHNMQAALKQVRANKGSAGADGMSVDELPDFLKTHWPGIRITQARHQPGISSHHGFQFKGAMASE